MQESYTQEVQNYRSDLLSLVVAKGAVKSNIGRHEPEIQTHLVLVLNTASMEEAIQQQKVTEA